MKRIIGALLIMISLFSVPAQAADDISVYLNGKKLVFDQPPIIRDDSTLVPFRVIFEELGMKVDWNDEEKLVSAENDRTKISLRINQPVMSVNGEKKTLLTPPIIYNDRTLVPLRAVSEAVGADVLWDGEARTVTITTDTADFNDFAGRVLALTNAEREKNGLNPLKWNDTLSLLAQVHCEDMIERNFFDHVNPDGETPFDRMRDFDIDYWTAGENIAAGQFSPEAVMEAWMNSKTHRENILNPNFRSLGICVLKGGSYGIYWVQEFAQLK